MKGLGLSKKRLLLNNSEITQDFLKTVALLKQNRGIVSNSSYALQTNQLKRRVWDKFKKKDLCTNLFMQAKKGKMTAIMGNSGCGKSVFIKMLAGCNTPSQGDIRVFGTPLSEMMNHVAYVPQGDVLIPELTGKSSLNYTLRLFAPYLTVAERQLAINHVIRSLEVEPEALNLQIGCPEWQGSFPSGGQRRRINLAHELVRFPEIIILDEPTSGLSASDAEKVISVLRKLADSQEMTVISSIHSPNSVIFNMFDDLLLVGSRGRICYYGPRQDSWSIVTQSAFGSPDDLINAMKTSAQVDALAFNYNHYMTNNIDTPLYYPKEPL